jgi:hypothetical protein
VLRFDPLDGQGNLRLSAAASNVTSLQQFSSKGFPVGKVDAEADVVHGERRGDGGSSQSNNLHATLESYFATNNHNIYRVML